MSLFLLDTHALIWWMDAGPLSSSTIQTLQTAMQDGMLRFSPISFWEIGMLQSKEQYMFLPTLEIWCGQVIDQSGGTISPLSTEAAILSTRLPGDFHKDPADRLLVASAIEADMTFVTRDAKILAWAAQTKALKVLPC